MIQDRIIVGLVDANLSIKLQMNPELMLQLPDILKPYRSSKMCLKVIINHPQWMPLTHKDVERHKKTTCE